MTNAVLVLFSRLYQAWFGSRSRLDSTRWTRWLNACLFKIFDRSGSMTIGLVSEMDVSVGVLRERINKRLFSSSRERWKTVKLTVLKGCGDGDYMLYKKKFLWEFHKSVHFPYLSKHVLYNLLYISILPEQQVVLNFEELRQQLYIQSWNQS